MCRDIWSLPYLLTSSLFHGSQCLYWEGGSLYGRWSHLWLQLSVLCFTISRATENRRSNGRIGFMRMDMIGGNHTSLPSPSPDSLPFSQQPFVKEAFFIKVISNTWWLRDSHRSIDSRTRLSMVNTFMTILGLWRRTRMRYMLIRTLSSTVEQCSFNDIMRWELSKQKPIPHNRLIVTLS